MYFAFFGGGAAWTLHLIGAYLIAEFGCLARVDHATWMGVTWIAWSLLALSVVMVATAGMATVIGWREKKRLQTAGQGANGAERKGDAGDEELDIEIHFARSGAIMSGLFTLVILFQTIPIFFYLGSC